MTKECIICKMKIIDTKEKWVRLTDFDKKAQTGEVFYHLECWRDRFNISNSMRKQKMYKQAREAMGNIGKALKMINPNKPKEVYQTIPN